MANCPIRILDGGLGTSLQDRYGVEFSSAATPLWSSHLLATGPQSEPETLLQRCQADFCRAGADVLETATYQISTAGLARTRVLPDHPDGIVEPADVYQFLERAVAVAEAAGNVETEAKTTKHETAPSIALSLGPYGACMIPSTEYSGAYDFDGRNTTALRRWHADRLRLFDVGVNRLADRVRYLAFETVPRLDEIVAVRQLYNVSGNHGDTDTIPSRLAALPYWISCVFPGDSAHEPPATLPDGSTVEQAVEAMLTSSSSTHLPWGIGINCTKIGRLPQLIERYEAAVESLVATGRLSDWPALVLYPDGTNGEVYNTTTQRWEMPAGVSAPKDPWEAQLSQMVLDAASRGKWREILVGGCCKATDRDIKALKASLREPRP
ncbi:homocysteine s-methyltransferase [Grosmannia clavigera kw1407]|uniref:Homocysteine s-methyltransferase n=1 Tax=Grosmannia clavigera (strain kw1407 / UAMH 11150) TaxID=655863 RepID=F0XQN6_GROCL|nr:homocysteine s-methyltransferase [Grosmannia clavigera kw1407]EFW99907.1 homocysteine s-methyltransferase [Grosmannia clavigera kw1407]